MGARYWLVGADIGECGPIVLAVEHGELVAQDDDLDVFGAAGPNSEAGQRREEAVQDAIHTDTGSADGNGEGRGRPAALRSRSIGDNLTMIQGSAWALEALLQQHLVW